MLTNKQIQISNISLTNQPKVLSQYGNNGNRRDISHWFDSDNMTSIILATTILGVAILLIGVANAKAACIEQALQEME